MRPISSRTLPRNARCAGVRSAAAAGSDGATENFASSGAQRSSQTFASSSRRRSSRSSAAVRDELVREPERRLLLPDRAVDLVRAIARPAGREEVLPSLFVRHAKVVPHRAPLLVPKELGAALER